MTCLFGIVLSVALSLSAGLSLDLLPGRHDMSSSKPYSTNRLLHELQNQMQSGMGSSVNLPDDQLSKKRSSAFQADDYTSKSDGKDDSFSTASGSYSRSDESLGPVWDPLYSYPELHNFRGEVKRNKRGKKSGNSSENQELEEILKDDDSDKKTIHRERKIPPDVKRQDGHGKKKRQSDEAQTQNLKEHKKEKQSNSDFQEWLRKEYYRNMAKSFASMRRKRAGWGPLESSGSDARFPPTRHTTAAEKQVDRFEEVTSDLKSIQDALLSDALHLIKEHGGEYTEDLGDRNRITNDLNAAYDLETMRTALSHLKETLKNMNDDSDGEEMIYENYGKRGDQCPALDVLTSDCSELADIVSEGPLKQLLLQACNWHEVCYSCGQAFGLSSDNCDVGFVEQSRTICRSDVPCQSTAGLLLLPLRQRRVFYKRSNPSVCFVDPCVEAFLKQG